MEERTTLSLQRWQKVLEKARRRYGFARYSVYEGLMSHETYSRFEKTRLF